MKKILIYMLITTMILMTACSDGGEKSSDSSEQSYVPASLEELVELSDQVVRTTMDKDWTESLSLVKDIQDSWNEVQVDLQKKGVPKEVTDDFVGDLNILCDLLISKTVVLSNIQPEQAEQGDQQQEGEQQQQGQQQVQQQDMQQSQNQSSPTSANPVESEQQDQESLQGQEGEQQEDEQKNKDPQKVLEEIDPMALLNSEELDIVSSATDILSHIPKFTAMFDDPVPAELYLLKYHLYHLNVLSKESEWGEVVKAMDMMQETWSTLEFKIQEKDEGAKAKLAQYIEEIDQVVDEKNEQLIGMKTNSAVELVQETLKVFQGE